MACRRETIWFAAGCLFRACILVRPAPGFRFKSSREWRRGCGSKGLPLVAFGAGPRQPFPVAGFLLHPSRSLVRSLLHRFSDGTFAAQTHHCEYTIISYRALLYFQPIGFCPTSNRPVSQRFSRFRTGTSLRQQQSRRVWFSRPGGVHLEPVNLAWIQALCGSHHGFRRFRPRRGCCIRHQIQRFSGRWKSQVGCSHSLCFSFRGIGNWNFFGVFPDLHS